MPSSATREESRASLKVHFIKLIVKPENTFRQIDCKTIPLKFSSLKTHFIKLIVKKHPPKICFHSRIKIKALKGLDKH